MHSTSDRVLSLCRYTGLGLNGPLAVQDRELSTQASEGRTLTLNGIMGKYSLVDSSSKPVPSLRVTNMEGEIAKWRKEFEHGQDTSVAGGMPVWMEGCRHGQRGANTGGEMVDVWTMLGKAVKCTCAPVPLHSNGAKVSTLSYHAVECQVSRRGCVNVHTNACCFWPLH